MKSSVSFSYFIGQQSMKKMKRNRDSPPIYTMMLLSIISLLGGAIYIGSVVIFKTPSTSVKENNNADTLVTSSTTSLSELKLDEASYSSYRKLINSLQKFESTLKSCLGRYCMDESYYTSEGNKVDRLALMSPSLPGYVKVIQDVMKLALSENAELILTSHVPPYGYGKTHGLTRIVRFLDNIAIQAYLDLLYVNATQPSQLHRYYAAQVNKVA
jgi:hypothetical protein